MPNLHIVIGDSNTRKSSLLRCLTGVGGGAAKKDMNVSLKDNTEILVHCIVSALQENYKPKTPAQFITYVKTMRPIPTDIAFTLRVSARGAYPEATTYIQAFTKVGWQVKNIALLDASACAIQGLLVAENIAPVPNSIGCPTNKSADLVRNIWLWK